MQRFRAEKNAEIMWGKAGKCGYKEIYGTMGWKKSESYNFPHTDGGGEAGWLKPTGVTCQKMSTTLNDKKKAEEPLQGGGGHISETGGVNR